ncbi:MAG: hypothetical protein HS104_20420 [Polyangiaceae bacterium]|nr:hypothetical protein [Polyangiaceae bacterium]
MSLLTVTLALAAPLLLAWAVLSRRSVRRRRVWRRLVRRADALRRRRLLAGVPLRGSGAELDVGPAVLRGVLISREQRFRGWVLTGEGRLRRASPLAGHPVAASMGELREDLLLELEDGTRVALAPPLRTVVGSEQTFTSLALRWLYTGDAVLARGVLQAEHRAKDYRSSAEQAWTLVASSDVVELATVEPSGAEEGLDATLGLSAACALWGAPRWVLYGMLVATAGVALLGGVGLLERSREQRCAAAVECASAGLCGAVWRGGVLVCGAGEDAHCAASAVCREENRCRARDGECQPSDCTASCAASGQCAPAGTTCLATSDRDCQQSAACRERGLCTERHGRCTLTADGKRDCSRDVACKSHGHCTSTPRGCLAVTHSDCAGSADCAVRGRCAPDGQGLCRAFADAHCKDSEVCRRFGFCTAVAGGCALDRQDTCGAFTECDYRGKCAKRGDSCVPTRDEHCALSLACVTHEQCRVEGQECVK